MLMLTLPLHLIMLSQKDHLLRDKLKLKMERKEMYSREMESELTKKQTIQMPEKALKLYKKQEKNSMILANTAFTEESERHQSNGQATQSKSVML